MQGKKIWRNNLTERKLKTKSEAKAGEGFNVFVQQRGRWISVLGEKNEAMLICFDTAKICDGGLVVRNLRVSNYSPRALPRESAISYCIKPRFIWKWAIPPPNWQISRFLKSNKYTVDVCFGQWTKIGTSSFHDFFLDLFQLSGIFNGDLTNIKFLFLLFFTVTTFLCIEIRDAN